MNYAVSDFTIEPPPRTIMQNCSRQVPQNTPRQSSLAVVRFVLGVLIAALSPDIARSEAGDPVLSGNHPLNAGQAGAVLLSELRCGACHQGVAPTPYPAKSAPDLTEVGSRISPAYLRRYLASPATVHQGTTMPDVLAAKPQAERDTIAEALTHYLISQSKTGFTTEKTALPKLAEGKELYHTVGCVACHGPREALDTAPRVKRNDEDDEDAPPKKPVQPTAVNLSHVSAKYSAKSLGEFLFQPLRVRPAGRMPDMKLTPAEARAIAGYLIGEETIPTAAFVTEPALVSAGQKYFGELNCAACHTLGTSKPAPLVRALSDSDFTRGCLSKTAGHHPQYHLAEAQVQAIAAAVREKPSADADQAIVAKTLTAFNCIACHQRDDYGGVPEIYNVYFQTSEKNLGDDARIPPPLTMVGAKLQTAWLKKVLFDGESVRPYMATRMPQFGTANLHHLPEVLARLDVMKTPALTIPDSESKTPEDREQAKLLRAAGRELLGDKGLNCVNCHNFNGKPSPTNKGIDLMTSYQRLQPGWFSSFLRNPSALRPRIVMPTAWPDGIATHKKILDGNTDQQIAAIWFYFSLGTSAADPPGIRVESTKLVVGDKAELHRGRSRVAGFRGIAVGLPEKLSYAMNAETGTLSAIWQGDFVSVNWQGQGAGDFNPIGETITLAQDVSFAALSDEKAAWPLLPVMTKEAPINPDPLYPKNVGYQFRGYKLDELGVPTFMYRSGTIEIMDRTVAAGSTSSGSMEQRQLKRVLQMDSPEQQTIWFRALTGDIQQESVRSFRNGKLRLTIPAVETKLRPSSADAKKTELLLRPQVPKGKSELEFLYEILAK